MSRAPRPRTQPVSLTGSGSHSGTTSLAQAASRSGCHGSHTPQRLAEQTLRAPGPVIRPVPLTDSGLQSDPNASLALKPLTSLDCPESRHSRAVIHTLRPGNPLPFFLRVLSRFRVLTAHRRRPRG
jgi:hypothetical protein